MTTVEPFGARLARTIESRGGLCVGIDPHPELLDAWGLPDDPRGLDEFGRRVVEAMVGRAGIVKPQVAFFERFGSAGFAVLERLCLVAREAGLLVIADAKRGDIGSSNRGYAAAWLAENSPFAVDALTISPYLGLGSLEAFFSAASDHGTGVFVLAATSNPEAALVQSAHVSESGRTVASEVVAAVREHNAHQSTAGALGSVGLVLGATAPLRARGIGPADAGEQTPVLAPGFGAQGALLCEAASLFPGARHRLVANVSRSVLRAGPDSLGSAIDDASSELAAGWPARRRLTVLAGPTAVGKGTVAAYIRDHHPQVMLSVSATTRHPRPGEINGVHYYFVTDAEFDRMIANHELLEWATVHNAHRYGTPRRPVESALAAGRPVLLEIDLQGARQVRRNMPDARLVFLAPPSWDELVRRLRGRGTEGEAEQRRRLRTAKVELAASTEFDDVIVNDSVPRAADEVVHLMNIE